MLLYIIGPNDSINHLFMLGHYNYSLLEDLYKNFSKADPYLLLLLA